MKKTIMFSMLIFSTFLLVSCFNGSNKKSKSKITIEKISITNQEYVNHNDILENYYVNANSVITLNIFTKNPYKYDVSYLVVDNVKYEEDYLTVDENHIKIVINVGRQIRKHNFEIPEIGYLVNDELEVGKLVETYPVNLFVRAQNDPEIKTTEISVEYDTYVVEIYLQDILQVVDFSNDSFKVELFNGEELIQTQLLTEYINEISFKNLKIFEEYNYVVSASYDKFDGEGIKKTILTEKSFVTKNPITAKINSNFENKANFTYSYDDIVDVKSIKLYHNDNLKQSVDLNSTEILGLLMGQEYNLVFNFEYIYNNNKVSTNYSVLFKTYELIYESVIRSGTEVKNVDGSIIKIPSYKEKDKEIRGVWVSTVSNIDIKTMNGSGTEAIRDYKERIELILDNIADANFNTVFFQIRPMNDAWYQSRLAPWSRYITGYEGRDPGFDVLKFIIEEAHKRNLELHGWLNPYRVSSTGSTAGLHDDNFAKRRPDLLLQNSTGTILDPGQPEVIQYIRDVISEIVTNYPDINGIHFDDYFYLSNFGENSLSPDYSTYLEHRTHGNQSIADFRRHSVTKAIKGIYEDIVEFNEQNETEIRFGISPSGIWANKSNAIPEGSDTGGMQHYSALYADTKLWIEEGYIHYIIPQIYWDFTLRVAPFAHLVDWWSDVVKDTDVTLIIGQGLYRYRDSWVAREIPEQLRYMQLREEVKGTTFFTYQDIVATNPDRLKNAMDQIKEFWQNKVDQDW